LQEARGERQEARREGQEARGKRQKTRDKRQEAELRQEARGKHKRQWSQGGGSMPYIPNHDLIKHA
jgi:hypothetical protein